MVSYILEGAWIAKSCALLGVIVFIAYQSLLILTKKRALHDYKEISKLLLVAEFLLFVYVCAILKITGIIDKELYFGFSPSNLMGFFTVPFVGASIKMVALNYLLFVPYGFLVGLVFKKAGLNWWKALLVGFCSSFCIEMIQAFTGRLTELDDLIINTAGFVAGFLIAEAVKKMRNSKLRKKGILQIVLVFAVSIIGLYLLSFVANGDKVQADEDAYYNGIGSPVGTLNEELGALSEMRVYYGGDKYDVRGDESSSFDEWYTEIGMDIGNHAGMYVATNYADVNLPVFERHKIYFEVFYSSPQLFRFYNNRDWIMEDVTYMVYCVNDGELWYGNSAESITYHAYYDSKEYPYVADEDMVSDISAWNGKNDE